MTPPGTPPLRILRWATICPTLPPSPAGFLKQLAREIDSSIRFYELYSGPFPFRNLGVSQIPGAFGQGWPGLLYLSTLSFLPDEAQYRAGLSPTGRAFFTDVVPFHEVAHQWWGNVVGWSSYQDQWIDEAIAEYLALQFADSKKTQDHPLNTWLTNYRKRLTTKAEGEDRAPGDIGPVIAGRRLNLLALARRLQRGGLRKRHLDHPHAPRNAPATQRRRRKRSRRALYRLCCTRWFQNMRARL